jgi:hypothetical protein
VKYIVMVMVVCKKVLIKAYALCPFNFNLFLHVYRPEPSVLCMHDEKCALKPLRAAIFDMLQHGRTTLYRRAA